MQFGRKPGAVRTGDQVDCDCSDFFFDLSLVWGPDLGTSPFSGSSDTDITHFDS